MGPLCETLPSFFLISHNPCSHLEDYNLQVDRGTEVLASVDGVLTELLLDAEDLVELGKTLGTGRSTGLDLAGTETDSNVSNGDILGLTGAVGDHDTPAVGVGVLGGLDGLGESADLVDLEEEGVARLELNGLLDAQGVGNGQVITDNLEVGGLVEVAPGLPIILSEGVLDGDNGVLGSKLLVQVGELLVGDPLGGVAIGVLEVEVVLLLLGLVELAGGNVHGDRHLASVAGLLNGIGNEVKSLLGGLNIGSDTTLVADVASGLAVLLLGKGLELLVDLRALAEGLGEGGSGAIGGNGSVIGSLFDGRSYYHCCTDQSNLLRDNHELLEGQTATGVGTTVQDVLEGNGQDIGLLGAGEVGDVSVEGDTLLGGSSLGNSQGDTEDGVGTKVALVGSAVELVEELVNLGLVLDIDVLLDESGANGLVNVLDSLQDTCDRTIGVNFSKLCFTW